jgi:hypothetical protein
MAKKQEPKKTTTLNLRLLPEEKAALEKRAKRERMTVTALIRRVAMGLVPLLLVACGGSEFSSDTSASGAAAGMAATGGTHAGGGAGGSGNQAGGAGDDGGSEYDGPTFVVPGDDDGTIVVRGLVGPAKDFTFHVAAPYHGPAWQLTLWWLTIDGENLVGFNHSLSNTTNDGVTETTSAPIGDVGLRLTGSEVLVATVARTPIPDGGVVEPVTICDSMSVTDTSGSVVAAWP